MEKIVIFWDVWQASGPANSDPIQIGLVKYKRGIEQCRTEINIFTKNPIDHNCSRNIHKIYKRGKTLVKDGKVLQNVKSQDKAIEEFEAFIVGCDYLISHGEIDQETYRSFNFCQI